MFVGFGDWKNDVHVYVRLVSLFMIHELAFAHVQSGLGSLHLQFRSGTDNSLEARCTPYCYRMHYTSSRLIPRKLSLL